MIKNYQIVFGKQFVTKAEERKNERKISTFI